METMSSGFNKYELTERNNTNSNKWGKDNMYKTSYGMMSERNVIIVKLTI